jgi:hypothetical protein
VGDEKGMLSTRAEEAAHKAGDWARGSGSVASGLPHPRMMAASAREHECNMLG